jgi:hypothetical protein
MARHLFDDTVLSMQQSRFRDGLRIGEQPVLQCAIRNDDDNSRASHDAVMAIYAPNELFLKRCRELAGAFCATLAIQHDDYVSRRLQ